MTRSIVMHIKNMLNKQLHGFGLNNMLRYSLFYAFYLKLRNLSCFQPQRKKSQMYKSLIGAGKDLLVFDIGASCGTETAVFLRLGARVIAVDPDRTCLRVLRMRFRNNKNIIIVDKAVSDKAREEKFYITGGGSGFNTLSSKLKETLENHEINRFGCEMQFDFACDIQTITLNDLFRQFGVPCYIKIDVAGYEYNVLRGLSRLIPILSFDANLPEFTQETINCLSHLHKISQQSKFNYSVYDKLELKDFVSYEEFLDFFRQTKLRYMEIYCKMVND
jgi:FkbM family methyltransferase